MHIDRRLLGWGLFFILAGGIPLAVRTNLLDESIVSDWAKLWPVLLIGWGIGLVLRATPIEWIGGAIVSITFGIMAGGLLVNGVNGLSFAAGCNGSATAPAFPDRTGTLGATARVDVEFNCGTLTVGAADGSSWSLTGSDRAGHGPQVTSTTSVLSVKADDADPFSSSGRSTWNLNVPRASSLELGVTLNAGTGTIVLDGAQLGSGTFTVNAGKLDFDLSGAAQAGDIDGTVNAGSAAVSVGSGERNLSLSLNAGSMQVCLAEGTPVRVTWAGTLGSNNLSSAGLTKVDDNTWTSPGLDSAQPHSELHVSATAGSFNLRFGGTCRA